MFYTILDNQLWTASNQKALTQFYDNVMELPSDYETDKYIVEDGKLVLNPEWEEINLNNKKASVRGVRNSYLADTDLYMITDFPITEEEREKYKLYRQYLRDYTKEEGWWEENPMDFNTWKQGREVLLAEE